MRKTCLEMVYELAREDPKALVYVRRDTATSPAPAYR